MMRQITHIGPIAKRVDAYIIDDSSLLSIYPNDDYAVAYLDPLIACNPAWALFRDDHTGTYYSVQGTSPKLLIALDLLRHPETVAARLLSQ